MDGDAGEFEGLGGQDTVGFLAADFSFQQYLSCRLQIGDINRVSNKRVLVFAVTANNKRLTFIEHLLHALGLCNITEACPYHPIESVHQPQS